MKKTPVLLDKHERLSVKTQASLGYKHRRLSVETQASFSDRTSKHFQADAHETANTLNT